MHRTRLLIASAALLAAAACPAQDTKNLPTLGEVIWIDPELGKILPQDAKIEVVSSGFVWSEGPVWVKDSEAEGGGFLLFSEIPRNSVYKWELGKGSSLWLQPSGYTGQTDYGAEPGSNGLALDAKGRLVSCEHGDRRISVMTENGGKRTLVDNYEGKRLNSPNDLCFKSNGDLYFTDPPYGLPDRWEDPRRELDFCGVYRLGTDGKLTLLTKEMTRPNGIAFSPDEKTLYVAQSDPEAAIWKAFPVKEDGTLGESKVLHDATELVGKEKGLPDGMKVDAKGNLFATGPGGVWIFDPTGKPLGRLATGEATSNCGWGNDGSVLYITADTYICRIQTKTVGDGW
ncbi:MAG: SMP-30/gluconolactonase/LRE family protein [Verrucomicrobiales bacterium]